MSLQQIPKTMKAAVLKEFGKPTEFGELPVPELKEGQVLIQVKAAPINPSDLSFLQGVYPVPAQLPTAPGLEGSGLVVKAFSEKDQALVGKKVAFFGAIGTYAEYIAVQNKYALPMPEDVSYETAACCFVNPLTVISMLQRAKDDDVKAVVHTAAASQLGKQMVKYFQSNGVDVINVVRRKEQEEQLQKIGAKYILNQNDADFEKQLKELATKLNAKIAYDPVSGEMTGKVLDALPVGSNIYVYGGLSGKGVESISLKSLIFEQKKIQGYWLSVELNKRTPQQVGGFMAQLGNLLKGDLASEISKEFTYKDFNEAVAFYSKNMSAGKVLIKPEIQN